MGWITGSYGMTTNIGLLQAEIDETTLNLNSEDKVQINLAHANTWTAVQTFGTTSSGAIIVPFAGTPGGNNIALGSTTTGNVNTFIVGNDAVTTNTNNDSLSFGANNNFTSQIIISSYATNSAKDTQTFQTGGVTSLILGDRVSNPRLVKTANNTLDDGSGNMTVATSGAGIVSANGIKTTAGAATTVTVGASPYTYTNSSASNQQIFIQGGTVSAISFNPNGGTGIALSGLTDNVITMRPDDTLTITYTAAPTVNTIQL